MRVRRRGASAAAAVVYVHIFVFVWTLDSEETGGKRREESTTNSDKN